MADTHVTSGFITVGSGLAAVGSGMNVIVGNFPTNSISGQTVNVGNFPTTSVSGNVVDISGQFVQASFSGNVLVTSFSGNVITTINQSPPIPSITWKFVNTGFILPSNTSGGVDLPAITMNSGLNLCFVTYSGQPGGAGVHYGVSGFVYFSASGAGIPLTNPQSLWIGDINVIPGGYTGLPGGSNLWPFTSTSQIKVIATPESSGATLVYGGFM